MKKYLALLSISWQNGFAYRISVFLWRFRQFLSTFFSLTVWTILYQDVTNSFGYSQSQMIAYIFLTSLIQNLVITSALNGLTSSIYSGEISILLVKPIKLFRALAMEEVADKSKNFIFALLESFALFLLFKPEFFAVLPWHFLVGIIWLIGAIALNFCISLLFGAIGFWSPESWGPRFLFFTFVNFVGGKFFPIDILPKVIQTAVWLTPFPYLSFAPTQVFLNRLDTTHILLGSFGLIFWLISLTIIVRSVWKIGLREYTAMGQ